MYDSSHISVIQSSNFDILSIGTHNVNQFLSSHLNYKTSNIYFSFTRAYNEPSKQPRMPYPACVLTDV